MVVGLGTGYWDKLHASRVFTGHGATMQSRLL